MIPLGIVLASGALGLLIGFAMPALRIAAAIGLVIYYVCAVSAHLRVGDRGFGGAPDAVVAGGQVGVFGAYHGAARRERAELREHRPPPIRALPLSPWVDRCQLLLQRFLAVGRALR